MNIVAREVKPMPALRWAAAAAVAGILAGDVAVAAADAPPDASPTPTPAASPTPAPTASPTASPTPAPETPVLPFPVPPPVPSGTTIYVMTVTTTTTSINAPITWVAAPITTSVSNTSASPGTPAGSLDRTGAGKDAKLEVDLAGCGASSPAAAHKTPQRAQLRLPQSGTLLLRVNGRRVGSLQLPSGARGVPLRIELGKDGMLSVRRPSGSVLHVRACTASKEAS
jgi:hypothetical protein